jgi:hypothetical protein
MHRVGRARERLGQYGRRGSRGPAGQPRAGGADPGAGQAGVGGPVLGRPGYGAAECGRG